MSYSNTSEELKRIRENELSDLSSTIKMAEKRLKGKVSPEQYDRLMRTITRSRMRIAHLNIRTGRTPLPKGNKPKLILTQIPIQTRRKTRH